MACSAAAATDVPLPGTATSVAGWLCVEHPGPWGRDVLGDEVLGPEITAELAARTAAAHVRPTLIRRPGRREFTGSRTVLLASSRPSGAWCERLEITDPTQLLDLDMQLLNGPPPGIGVPVSDPLVLVCVHGKRDRCCALLGRPIAADLAGKYPGQVWECSHTGGHRFAPALVLLPSGLTYGRLDPVSAAEVVAAAHRGTVATAGLRGRSCYTAVEQVAEIAVRDRGVADADDLMVELEPSCSEVPVVGAAIVTHRDGRRWRVTVRSRSLAPRQASCHAAPKEVTALIVDEVQLLTRNIEALAP
ncbi:sucrase ferredoxin [Nocardia sp. CNY236]|uniref:sucrase ferredoxin n=1 Tax=Nocardia sp. CNY236 TaxID=1169152 RepID=UPI000562327C|nr:sucrase ferredoxin [Nocardia sp. CNY236]